MLKRVLCCVCCARLLQLCLTPWDPINYSLQAALSMGFSRQGVDCHTLWQRVFPTQELNSSSVTSPALAGGFFTTSDTWEVLVKQNHAPNVMQSQERND